MTAQITQIIDITGEELGKRLFGCSEVDAILKKFGHVMGNPDVAIVFRVGAEVSHTLPGFWGTLFSDILISCKQQVDNSGEAEQCRALSAGLERFKISFVPLADGNAMNEFQRQKRMHDITDRFQTVFKPFWRYANAISLALEQIEVGKPKLARTIRHDAHSYIKPFVKILRM